MIVTKDFLFIHFFRTGGTFINELLEKYLHGQRVGYHRPRSLIPKEFSHLPVIGNIRNPWDWYVSVYHHAINWRYPHGAGTFLNWLLDYQKYDFKEALTRLLMLDWMSAEDKKKALQHFPEEYDWEAKLTDNLRKQELVSYLESGKGFYSWFLEYMYCLNGDMTGVYFCRTERLREDFGRALETLHGSVEREIIDYLQSRAKLNAMAGQNSYFGTIPKPRIIDYRKYYDDELAALVYTKDQAYIEKFDYEFSPHIF